MTRIFKAKSVNDAFIKIAEELDSNPDFISYPRGVETKEIVGCLVNIKNSYDRIVRNIYRNISLKYLVGEWLWYERGSNSLEEISYYSKFWKKITDDGNTANSSYGYRILGKHTFINVNQWEYVKKQLIKDKDSRRAIILICVGSDLKEQTKDCPCTMFLQFFIRNNHLHLVANMRSNDLIFGLTYDIACFTMFQEKMLLELKKHYRDLQMGNYFHFTSSMHVYKKHYKMIQNILSNKDRNIKIKMPRMEDLNEIKKLQFNEKIIRTKSKKKLIKLKDKFCLWCQNILLN